MSKLDEFAEQKINDGWEIEGFASVPEWDGWEKMPLDYPQCPGCGKSGLDHTVWFRRGDEDVFFNRCYECGTEWVDTSE